MTEERRRLVETVRAWSLTHEVSEETAWAIQNLLGDYLGWNTPEQQEISEMFKKQEGEK